MPDVVLEETTTTVDEWIVTGEPGPMIGTDHRYPTYQFVWSSNDHRWPGSKAELEARRFVERCRQNPAGYGQWESGPFLHHRRVTYSPLEPVED